MKVYLNHSTTDMIHNDEAQALTWYRSGDRVEVLTYDDMGKLLSSKFMAPLKTNNKEARENIRFYIRDHFTPDGYDINQEPGTFEEMAAIIMDTFQKEKYYSLEQMEARRMSQYRVFQEWCSGLPSILDTCYYYNRSAVDDVAAILWQTPTQAEKYTEDQAEELLTRLIYRELWDAANLYKCREIVKEAGKK